MSASTAPSSSSGGGSDPQTGTEAIDRSAYIYLLPEDERIGVCYYLDQNNVWEEAARKMGYTAITDIIKIKKMAQDKRISPAEQLLSLWGDQNHTVTELFMVLNSIGQFSAMDCLKDQVDKKYHRLLLNGLPNLKILRGKNSEESKRSVNTSSQKILNGPEMSRDTNESENDTESMVTSNVDLDKIEEAAGGIPSYPFKDLCEATKNWDKNHILGSGGFATVFRGWWKYTDVAIKKIKYKSDDPKKDTKVQMKQSLNELRYLNSCRHDNILPLYGYSMDGPEPCLVYQFMAGGSLEYRLRAKSSINFTPLSFSQRKRIALGTARGLQYLHTYVEGKPLIHGDIKPANILLDPCCVPKIGDFGLVREGTNESMEVSTVYGTKPYLPQEFLINRIFSTKIDTFSFGVVLFELFTALRAYDKNRGENLAFLTKYMWHLFRNNINMIQHIDSLMDPATVNVQLFDQLMKIGLICTNQVDVDRPEMVGVLNELEKYIDKDEAGYVQ